MKLYKVLSQGEGVKEVDFKVNKGFDGSEVVTVTPFRAWRDGF